ncbi:hypothetical protein [Fervidicoccus fontis]|uniref:Uncharacterized protein n=2 Tax=Fervidicoccus fontis TaxID=683846 RepID=I0A1A7_FERFK|nr:hypothetical protein [Fervidicoccus fontis]AFH42764.1 hypothetical protein FFONT_0776 [Fervidicoccus fontis Kam940]PMB75407.1 MAG: 50S ribosomal protein L19e [Fervidicoccus fontis]PMB76683.1 MAG: 50S ribosomal protein L19e [Fervidicoccus fontis]HEW64002.1 hypothetical protein [Fervidicoccus fontis]
MSIKKDQKHYDYGKDKYWGDKKGKTGGYEKKERFESGIKQEREGYEHHQNPNPLGEKCNNLCPLFWCTKRAYQIRRDPKTGRKYVFCTWTNDECIGAACQYASCKANYLLPNGECGYAKNKVAMAQPEKEDIVEDIEKEDLDIKTKGLISKKLGKKKLDDII